MNDKLYWRSVEEFMAELPDDAPLGGRLLESYWQRLPATSRRRFLEIMGASLAFAGLVSCRRPEERIHPFSHRPEGRDPGVPVFYATSVENAGVSQGLLVKSVDGRPIKVEGNPRHPDSLGGATAASQALVLSLYDPDRSRTPLDRLPARSGSKLVRTAAEALLSKMAERFGSSGGSGLAILHRGTTSPTFHRLVALLRERMPNLRVHRYRAEDRVAERRGTAMAFDSELRPIYDFRQARVVASLDADFLYTHPSSLRFTRQIADSKDPATGGGVRLYSVEAGYSVTGAAADHRLALAPSKMEQFLLQLAGELADLGLHLGFGLPAAAALGVSEKTFAKMLAMDLMRHRGSALIVAGAGRSSQVHAIVHGVNAALGALGNCVEYIQDPEAEKPSSLESLASLTEGMIGGSIKTLLILGGNPVFTAPAASGFAAALSKVKETVHLGLYENETSDRCRWHLPLRHQLESFGDGLAFDGTVTMQQPLLEPLYGGFDPLEVLVRLAGESYDGSRRLVLETFAGSEAVDRERSFQEALEAGLQAGTRGTTVIAVPQPEALEAAAKELSATSAAGYEVALSFDPRMGDGSRANSGWLQELPDPITKLTWGNAAIMNPSTATSLGVGDGDVVSVEANGGKAELPVCVVPGVAERTIQAWLGYGRQKSGKVGTAVGVNLYPLVGPDGRLLLGRTKVSRTGKKDPIAITQNHFILDWVGAKGMAERAPKLLREATVDEYRENPEIFREEEHSQDLWKRRPSPGEQWGMVIDLNRCTGCSACVVACQAENNIPVVGKQQVIKRREMQWLRIDRYYKGDPATAEVAFQPVPCMQCEDAPCEEVCPVAATQHTEDGLNAMVYNRCVGTRYCANNCPYKVRRFNYFNFQKGVMEVEKMQRNPEVTVRSRGVMEKCTYCTQRIEAVRILAKVEDRELRDGEIQPACAESCPAKAIVFGNIADPESSVARGYEDNRCYFLLPELNVKPRTRYLAKLRNKRNGEKA